MRWFPNLTAANAARQLLWDPAKQTASLLYRANEMAGEVGEACNVIKKLERERLGLPGSRTTLQALADELADIVICADLTAQAAGIDLFGTAIPDKFNETSRKVGFPVFLDDQGPS